jgi:4-aminobutyrate aminotransferase/(S)-3-amino-2-methylpropionate transaminase
MTAILTGDFVYRSKHPIVVERASGARLFASNREYVDCQASSGAAVLGYIENILTELDTLSGPISKPQTCESSRRLKLAKRLERLIFDSLNRHGRIGFELGGAQAVELAVKIALSAHQNISLLTVEGSYHGRSLFTAHLSSSRRYTLGTTLAMPHFRLPNPFFVAEREMIGIAEATQKCIKFVEKAFSDERYGVSDRRRTAPVFIFEPVQNVAGMLDMPSDYLIAIERLVKEAGGLCIADEIFSGMYRFGLLFAHSDKGLAPDIVAFSKGLTNGMAPLSAVWVADSCDLATSFAPGTHSCTYLNNELAFMLADRVLDAFAKMDKTSIGTLGARFSSEIQSNCAVDLRAKQFSKGSVVVFNLLGPDELATVSHRILHQGVVGVLHASTGLAPRTLIFHPPYTIGSEDLKDAAAVIGKVMEQTLA